jgi:hypothetical protein
MPPRRPPASVLAATAALLVVAAVQIALVLAGGRERVNALQAALGIALVALLALGLLRGKRLAWLWGRYLGLFLAAAVVFGLVQHWRETSVLGVAILAGGLAAPPLLMSLWLGRRSAHEWFGLVCPSCGTMSGRGDLLLRKVRCPQCGTRF